MAIATIPIFHICRISFLKVACQPYEFYCGTHQMGSELFQVNSYVKTQKRVKIEDMLSSREFLLMLAIWAKIILAQQTFYLDFLTQFDVKQATILGNKSGSRKLTKTASQTGIAISSQWNEKQFKNKNLETFKEAFVLPDDSHLKLVNVYSVMV